MSNPTTPTTDQLVHAEDVRRVMQRLNGDSWRHALRELERSEPALASYLSTAAETLVMSLYRIGYPNEHITEARQYLLHAAIVVHVVTRTAYRQLLADFLPLDNEQSVRNKLLQANADDNAVTFDPVVTNDDGIRVMRQLLKEPVIDLASRLADHEPAITGVAVHVSNRTRDRLTLLGASPEVAEAGANSALQAGVMCAELLRQGHSKRHEVHNQRGGSNA